MEIKGYQIKTRADLSWANLSEADLSEADLREADLCGANLRKADLSGANLSGADLREADLREADLCGADLRGADLREADLRGADLSWANLSEANLCKAKYQISNVLHSIQWGTLSTNLQKELIYRDALICGKEKMLAWLKGGECPFSGNIQRDYYFKENRSVCKRILRPTMNDIELFKALCKATKIKLGD